MNLLKITLLLLLLNFSVSTTLALGERSVLLMFGDSITYGTPLIGPRPGFGNGGNFGPSVAEVQRLLNESRRPSLVVNWGAGGTNSSADSSGQHGLFRIDSNISTTLSQHAAERYFILIQYGTNDQGYGISNKTTGDNIAAMIDIARARGVTPVVANLPPRSDESVSSRNTEILNAAASRGLPIVDHNATFGPFPQYTNFMVFEPTFNDPNTSIYLHPNAAGYDLIAKNWVEDALEALIEPIPLPLPPVIAPIISLLLDDEN